ncbi:MAG: DUF5030 domain-containing protein [Bacteroidaceae bacterium]|nr:DUF5030 domain-containing protein [Bacteroidaceae bacterium]
MSVCLFTAEMYGQKITSFSFLQDKWNEYQQQEMFEPTDFLRIFKDRVSVEEMKEAFAKYKNYTVQQGIADYGEYDVVQCLAGANSTMIVSPLQRHPKKEIKDCHAVWHEYGSDIVIKDVKDRNGTSRKDYVEKLNKERSNWLNGDVVTLKHPCWYMGVVVSADPRLYIYDKGKLVCDESGSKLHYPDFFSYASIHRRGTMRLAGHIDWTYGMSSGALLLGKMHSMESATYAFPEKTFSVLLHACHDGKDENSAYTLELLEPEKADKAVLHLFKDFKNTVERLPANAFKAYYTTDFRIMTGRYYRVTVNKCGWLVEDYFELNKVRMLAQK